ncbi:MAG TPA: hypothetical protein VE710_18190 [Candidatus Bathyarchaeia archaeon]|nr:hypothetical protein [Candidatus Bathyarchaeia archaeon]
MNLIAILLLMLLAAASGSVITDGQIFKGSFMLGTIIFFAMIIVSKAEKGEETNTETNAQTK